MLATAIASRTRSVDRSRLALEAFAQHREGDIRGLPAGGLATDAVDHDEQAAPLVDVESILVHLALETGVGPTSRGDRVQRR